MRNPQVRIEDMLEAIQRIEKYAVRGKTAFASEELIQTYVVHNLQILGEAACKLTPEYRKQHPEIPWNQVIGMRHILVHDYFQVDLEIVWMVVEKELPKLKEQLLSLLNGKK